MVNFRRVVTALAVLALFTGLAFAQSEQCSAQATVSTPLRNEGYTEQTGDIIINCVSGQPLLQGASIPLVNIQVSYSTSAVTSRLLGTALASGQTPSEALLLIDEPTTGNAANIGTGAGQSSYGSTLGLIPCLTPATGCAQTVGAPSTGGFATAMVGANPAPNVYQGVTIGNTVTFYGVPVLPPSTIGSRVYRITNVRIDATGPGPVGQTQVNASITVSGSAALPISNASPIVGYIQKSLTASVGNPGSFNQCVSQKTQAATGTLKFQELFGTAFKTRVAAQSTAAGAGQLGVLNQAPTPPNQSTPGGIYNSESNFVYGGAYSTTAYTAGLADFGTRLKANFSNIPPGVHIYVSTANVGANASAQGAPGGSGGNLTVTGTDYVGLARLVTAESTSDGAGTLPAASTDVSGTATSEVLMVADVNGLNTGTAVWEVVNTNPNTSEGFTFNVFLTFTSNTASNIPKPTVAPGPTVTLSYAPTSTVAGVTIPRFTSNPVATGTSIFTITVCRTILLYPYLVNQGGFDTGFSVANTSSDNYSTGFQKGDCTFNFYGKSVGPPPPPFNSHSDPDPDFANGIPAGRVYATNLSTVAPGFLGYMIAECNFQYAHGFAFVSDVGARNFAAGYLALVIPDPSFTAGVRTPTVHGVGAATGEQDAH